MRKLYHLIFIMLLCWQGMLAQDLIGKVTDQDAAQAPLYMAEVDQIQNGKTIATYKTYFDGTYHMKVKAGQTYQLRASFPGRADTTVSISIDKHGALYSGTVFISLRKDGMRLTGYVLDGTQDLPIRDACIILRNVMTRKEERYTTGADGSYNLKMDYETNYTFKIDKMSPGIINKYRDTSFNISTIGFNKPLDFRLDIRLGPSTDNTIPRPEYDPHAKPDNRNLKPALTVLGVRDSIQKHRQDSLVAVLSKKLYSKDSVITSLDKRINDIHKVNNENNTAVSNIDTVAKKTNKYVADKSHESDSIRRQVATEQQKKDLQKAEADIKAKRQAEKERQEKLDKEINNAETREWQKEALASERQHYAIAADRQKAEEDSLLKIALAKNKEILERRKHVRDSLSLIEDRKTDVKVEVPRTSSIFRDEDGSVVDISPTGSPVPEAKTDITATVEAARITDSIRIKQAIDVQKRKRPLSDSMKTEQDSLLRIAMAKNNEAQERRKRTADSLTAVENQKLQAINEGKKGKYDRELAEKELHEKQEREAAARTKAEIDEKERKAKEEAQAAAIKAEQDAAMRKAQIAKEQEAKKAREEAEAKILKEKKDKEAVEKIKNQKEAQEEAKRKTEAYSKQRELETQKDIEQKEKDQLKQQLGKLNKNEQPVAKDQGTIQLENKIATAQVSPSSAISAKGIKQIIASGSVKSGKTLDPVSGVSINVRRLNSVVSQEVMSDQDGKYQISLDSGYFYLVSYYTAKYEISKQLVDLISYKKSEYNVPTQYLKEIGDFDPGAGMQSIQFSKNSPMIPANIWSDLQNIIKALEDDPTLRIKVYGLASVDEDHTIDLSVDRARAAADLLMQNGIRASKISISGLGASRPISGCTEGKQCSEQSYQLDRVVMYKIVKE